MADRRTPERASGANITGRPDGMRRPPEDEIVDAEYETLPPAGPAQAPPDSSVIATAFPPVSGMTTLRRGERRPAMPPRARGGPLFWSLGVAVAAAAFWVSGGHALVRSAALFAEQPPARSLTLHGVTSRVDVSGARPVLFVDGEAVNEGPQPEQLHAFEIVVTGNDGSITRYRLGATGRSVAPGERFAFSSRLDVPKNGVRTVSVTFGE